VSFASDDAKWDAFLRRDPAADGAYICAVRSTGIYCRPTCAARKPRRENVSFHATAAEAERAGFRACKRCRPNAGLAETCRFAIGSSALGAVLVAASGEGVCAILLGDDPRALRRELKDGFPQAVPAAGDARLAAWLAAVVAFVESPDRRLAVPLDVRGTAFQQRVWQALGAIPPGATTSYAEVARKIGAPKAVRAVAAACAANRLAVAIPCHRVVRSDGGLSGYRWGAARKRALLAREAAGRQP
jgi:AraC family transcriptional regulator, regulatory protein of adaptative response / methylated-DNA-[protein]-cysteine methyltransferase